MHTHSHMQTHRDASAYHIHTQEKIRWVVFMSYSRVILWPLLDAWS